MNAGDDPGLGLDSHSLLALPIQFLPASTRRRAGFPCSKRSNWPQTCHLYSWWCSSIVRETVKTSAGIGFAQRPFADSLDHSRRFGQRNEASRGKQPVNRMLPAQQRFHARIRARAQIDKWMVMEAKLPVLQRLPQLNGADPGWPGTCHDRPLNARSVAARKRTNKTVSARKARPRCSLTMAPAAVPASRTASSGRWHGHVSAANTPHT